jgi:hypothetical protein
MMRDLPAVSSGQITDDERRASGHGVRDRLCRGRERAHEARIAPVVLAVRAIARKAWTIFRQFYRVREDAVVRRTDGPFEPRRERSRSSEAGRGEER